MKQQAFEQENAPLWDAVAAQLKPGKGVDPTEFPALYRRLCQSLALATQRGYSPSLTDHLHGLVLAAHRQLYASAAARPLTLRHWLGVEFPRRVRAEWRLLLLVLVAFWGVGIAVGLLIWQQPHWAYSLSDAQTIQEYRSMYQPANTRLGRASAQDDVLMFGFYVWNNVSICFRTFAGGLLGGIPALVSVVSNGVHAGLIASVLSTDPATRITFWSFVVTHSSFEITGLLLSGLAGLRLGWALIHPGRRSRRHALQHTSREMFPVIVGAALMVFLAAFFEAFWSASGSVAPAVKFTVGGVCWALVIGFFVFAGRERRAA